MIDDRRADVELAHGDGARTVMVRAGYEEGKLAWRAMNWLEALDRILREVRG